MKLALIGHMGGNHTFLDGQTVKTRMLFDALAAQGVTPFVLDTYLLKKNPLLFMGKFAYSICTCSHYLLVVSLRGRKFFFPLLYIASKIFKKKIYHIGIGGRLADEVPMHKPWKKYLSSFEANWVEAHQLVRRLHEQGITNAAYLPNFKDLQILRNEELIYTTKEPFAFCTFSRVMKEKGIEDAIAAVSQLNTQAGRTVATLDIYGQIDAAYQEEFKKLQATFPPYITYKGAVEANRSVEVLKNYFVLLFPTQFQREGIPGTIIDAFCAGIPVIARRWAYCDEMITHQRTGLIYDFDKPQELYTLLAYAVAHPQELNALKPFCLQEAQKYTPQPAIQLLLNKIKSSQTEKKV